MSEKRLPRKLRLSWWVGMLASTALLSYAQTNANPPVTNQDSGPMAPTGMVVTGGSSMTPGKWIAVSSAGEISGLTPVDSGKVLGYLRDGGHAIFGPLDFADGLVDRFEIELAAPRRIGTVALHLDSPTGVKIGEIGIVETGGYSNYAVLRGHCEQLAGTHRLVLLFRGGDDLCNVKALRFLKPGQEGSPNAIDPTVPTPRADFRAELESILAVNREGIEKHRTALITLRTAPGAAVRVRQIRHAFEFGTAINRNGFVPNERIPVNDQERYKGMITSNFNSVVHENEMKWYSNERERDKLDFADADTMLEWSEANGLYTRGHCVYWGRDNLVQTWLKELDNDSLREQIKQRARDYMEHFKSRVREHDVNNEMLHCHYYSKRLGADIRKEMFAWCHELDPKATLYVNDYSILSGGETAAYVAQIKGFLAAGMKVGGIGVQGHFGGQANGDEIRKKLDLLAQFGLPIKVTEFDANTKSEEDRARVLATVYATAFAHPSVAGLYMWGFWERLHWRPGAALWNADWSENLAGKTYRELVFKRWWTDFTGQADADGICEVRIFFGEIEVIANGQTRRITVDKNATDRVFDLGRGK